MLAVARAGRQRHRGDRDAGRTVRFGYAAIRMVLVALYLRAYRHVAQARGLIVVYLTAGAIAAGL